MSKTVPKRAGWIALIPLVIGYALDQWSKWLVVENMTEGQRIAVWEPILHWHFIRNPGAAFSIGTEYTWVFTIIQTVAALVVIFLLVRKVRSTIWAITLGALLAGILGNLTDRLLREPGFGIGHVVDFIAFPRFAIFNIADSLVVCSMIMIALLVIMGRHLDGTRENEGGDMDQTAHGIDGSGESTPAVLEPSPDQGDNDESKR